MTRPIRLALAGAALAAATGPIASTGAYAMRCPEEVVQPEGCALVVAACNAGAATRKVCGQLN